ncbi:MAG: UDP-glucose 4-epimerase, partial [Ruthenibacterium sp.]
YYRVSADERDLNYDQYFVNGQVTTESEEAYTSHNTVRLDMDGVVKKLLTNDYIQQELAENGN